MEKTCVDSAGLLDESRTIWSGQSENARKSHFGFCLHYEAEIRRLSGEPFQPPAEPPWGGTWGHPWMFVLLFRGPQPGEQSRHSGQAALRRLVAFDCRRRLLDSRVAARDVPAKFTESMTRPVGSATPARD